MSYRIPVKPELLQWAISRSGLQTLPARLKIQEWIKGKSHPTRRQLEDFARAVHVPFGYLLLEEPPQEEVPVPFYRTAHPRTPRQPSPELLDTIYAMQQRQEWMREYLIAQEAPRLDFVGAFDTSAPVDSLVEKLHAVLDLEPGWSETCPSWKSALLRLRQQAEQAGILVFSSGVVGNNTRRKLSVEEFRGFALVDEYAPLVFLNAADAIAAQMFTLVHELVHILLGESAIFDLSGMIAASVPLEKKCDATTAEFLVPRAKLLSLKNRLKQSTEPIRDVSRRFRVSQIVAARRLWDLRMIPRKEFEGFLKRYLAADRKKKKGGGDFYATQLSRLDSRFLEAVASSVRSGFLLHREAYQLVGVFGKSFDKLVERVTGRSSDRIKE